MTEQKMEEKLMEDDIAFELARRMGDMRWNKLSTHEREIYRGWAKPFLQVIAKYCVIPLEGEAPLNVREIEL